MTAQTQVPAQLACPAQPMREREARYAAGLTLILIDIVVLAAAGILFWQAAVHKGGAAAAFAVRGDPPRHRRSSWCSAASSWSHPDAPTSCSCSASTRAPSASPGCSG